MHQLPPQDAIFLSLETDELPSHIGGLAFLEPTAGSDFGYDRFVDFIRQRLGRCERFSWQLQEVPFGLDRPYWIECPDFDPAEHIEHVAVPAPYSDESLSRLVGMLFERPLDRERPLWEMILIEGLPRDHSVLLWKVHHCLMDGAAGANLVEQIFDLAPEAERTAPNQVEDSSLGVEDSSRRVEDSSPGVEDSSRRVEDSSLGVEDSSPGVEDSSDRVQHSSRAGNRLSTSSMLGRAIRNVPALQRRQQQHTGKAVRSFVRQLARNGAGEASETRPSLPPRAPFNGLVGAHRGIVWSRISLDEVMRLKNAASVTVNDVVLTVTSGAVRRYLADRNELPAESLVASVPLSLRRAGDTSLGNQVRETPISWSTDVEDPFECLFSIHESACLAKSWARNEDSIDLMGMMAETLLPGPMGLLTRGVAAASGRIPLPANAVVSNVPMAPVPLYCAGARITQVVPISMLTPSFGMNITVLSYCGEMHFGIVYDPDLLPDAWELAGLIPKSFLRLQAAVDLAMARDDCGATESVVERTRPVPNP